MNSLSDCRAKLERLRALKSSSMFPSPPGIVQEIRELEDLIFKLDMEAMDKRIADIEIGKKQREAEYQKLKGARA
ncbi:MAG TPA: hypothetical protein PKY31_04110 [Spirochaetota bacterium]|nr:hypothetical protein [Spirochaetota bacterium]